MLTGLKIPSKAWHLPGGTRVRMARMWAFWLVLIAMLGLYIWSHATAGHRIGKKTQPFVDDLFDFIHKGRGPKKDEKS